MGIRNLNALKTGDGWPEPAAEEPPSETITFRSIPVYTDFVLEDDLRFNYPGELAVFTQDPEGMSFFVQIEGEETGEGKSFLAWANEENGRPLGFWSVITENDDTDHPLESFPVGGYILLDQPSLSDAEANVGVFLEGGLTVEIASTFGALFMATDDPCRFEIL